MLLKNLNLATMSNGYGLLPNAALLVENGLIRWVGPEAEAPAGPSINCRGALATPGLIDCHTHLVYGGNRANEFEQRLNGADYAAIARAGGGIMSTVRATRAASEDDLYKSAIKRLDTLIAEGVTTVEIKSGYGLDVDTEAKMLRVARALVKQRAATIKTTFLGAHTIPVEFKDNRKEYVNIVCNQSIQQHMRKTWSMQLMGFVKALPFRLKKPNRYFKPPKP